MIPRVDLGAFLVAASDLSALLFQQFTHAVKPMRSQDETPSPIP